MKLFGPREQVVVRDVWQGLVLTGRPETVVTDTEELTALLLVPGTRWIAAPVYDTRIEAYERAADGELGARAERTWVENRVLSLVRPDDPYAIKGFWNPANELACWYVNLQAPLRRTSAGFDTMDHVLDVLVGRDLSWWQWKDEDEVRKVVELGLATQEMADEVRSQGETVIAMIERGDAWWTDWNDWAPDPDWPIPVLPEGWAE